MRTFPMDPETYMNRMIMCGDGVEGYENLGAEVDNVVVGRVLTCVPHPDSDHLHITTVDVGEGEPLQIVCGAPNCEAGILVPVAKVGAHLPGGVKIKKGKLRGVVSEGMLCSSDELGVPVELYPSVGSAGLLIFQEDHPLGADVRPILGIDDTVMDFEVLANRPGLPERLGHGPRDGGGLRHGTFHQAGDLREGDAAATFTTM